MPGVMAGHQEEYVRACNWQMRHQPIHKVFDPVRRGVFLQLLFGRRIARKHGIDYQADNPGEGNIRDGEENAANQTHYEPCPVGLSITPKAAHKRYHRVQLMLL